MAGQAFSAIVVGAGGHGRVVIDALYKCEIDISGIVDPSLSEQDSAFGVPVLGDDAWFDDRSTTEGLLYNGVGANPDLKRRQNIFVSLTSKGWQFGQLVHPFSSLGMDVQLGDGVQLMAGVVVQAGTQLGENVVVNTGALIDHDCVIGRHCFISPGVNMCGAVSVGSASFVGAGATILPGVEVPSGCVIGAGSVVTRSLAVKGIYVGNPARLMRSRE